MNIEVSIGEILDKLSILSIKKNYITQTEKLLNINKEYEYLIDLCQSLLNDTTINVLYNKLLNTNQVLWSIEDNLRIKEKDKKFDQQFIDLARSVYINNDIRADIKKQINILTNSVLCEEKSYESY